MVSVCAINGTTCLPLGSRSHARRLLRYRYELWRHIFRDVQPRPTHRRNLYRSRYLGIGRHDPVALRPQKGGLLECHRRSDLRKQDVVQANKLLVLAFLCRQTLWNCES
jgi:hypothetical protein